jgi:hypothetical protein
MSESDIYQSLKKTWKHYIDRIEDKLKGGIPDVILERDGVSFVELKLVSVQKNNKIKIKIRTSQYLWFKKYTGKAWMLVWDRDMYYLFQKINVQCIKNGMDFKDFLKKASYSSPKINKHMIDLL